jgi:copper transport protein
VAARLSATYYIASQVSPVSDSPRVCPRALLGVSLPLVVAVLWLVLAPAAYAHSAFLGSDPAPGVRLRDAPAVVTMRFTEPVNERLSRAKLVSVAGGRRIDARVSAAPGKRLVLRPVRPLTRGAYRVEWHTVSTEDGHALEGSFSFGVRAPAASSEHALEQGPFARGGAGRAAARLLFYTALVVFAGPVLLRGLLPDRSGASWLVPRPLHSELAAGEAQALERRRDAVVIDSGLAAAGLGVVVALLDSADAGGRLSVATARDFLLANLPGVARVALVALVLVAVAAARRMPTTAVGAVAAALASVSISGHANSASPRVLTILADWAHLLAGAIWLGGIALMVVVWGPTLRARGAPVRVAVARHVLDRFGRVALPAFLVVVVAGAVNAIVQLERVDALWETDYGIVLFAKINLVAVIAGASYLHAVRLRPQLLAGNPHPDPELERSHWRLLRAEPILAIGVVAAAALLVAFPLPPRQLGEADEASAATPPCNPCPLPRPAADELAVADQAGSHVVAAWIRRGATAPEGTVRLIDVRGRTGRVPFAVLDARNRSCGTGCRRFALTRPASEVRVALTERGRRFVAVLPARWRGADSARARALLRRAEQAMRSLRSVRQHERVSSGPGSLAVTLYDLQAPDRFAYRTNGGERSVVIGDRQWLRVGDSPWQEQSFGAGVPFRTRSWFRWTPYATVVRMLDIRRSGHRRVAEIALMDPGTPAWIRMWIDLQTKRVVEDRLVAKGSAWRQRYSRYDRAVSIRPPGRR